VPHWVESDEDEPVGVSGCSLVDAVVLVLCQLDCDGWLCLVAGYENTQSISKSL